MRLEDFTRQQKEKFNELRKILKNGALPVYLINPVIIKHHNENSPSVSQLHHLDTVSLDRLISLISGNVDIGIEARSFSSHMLQKQPRIDADDKVEETSSRRDRHTAMMDDMEDDDV